MKVLATSLGVLAFAATLGLVTAQDRPAREPDPAPPGDGRPRRHRRGSPTSGPSPTCSPRSSRRTTRRTPRRSATCSPRTPRSRTRTARSRGAATPSSSGSRGPSRKATATRSPWTPTPSGSSGPISPSRRARRRSRPGRTPRPRTNRYSVIYARQGGRWLHARDPRRAGGGRTRARAAPGTRVDARRVGQRERRRGGLHHLQVVGRRQLPAPRFRREGRGPHRPERHPAHRLGRPAGAVPHVGLRRRRRVRRGVDVARRRRWVVKGRASGRTGSPSRSPPRSRPSARTGCAGRSSTGRSAGRPCPSTDRFELVRRPPNPAK